MKRLNFSLLILFLIILAYPVTTYYAQPLNVLDCLDNEKDCAELEENEQEENELLPVEQNETGSVILNVVKMIFALLLVLILIYVVVKLLSSRQKLNNRVHSLENLGGISVGHNKSIQIVRVGSKFYLVGVGDNVELLQEITEDDVIETLLQQEGGENESIGSYLLSLIPNKKQQEIEQTDEFKNKFAAELEKIKHQRKTLINKHTEKEDEHD